MTKLSLYHIQMNINQYKGFAFLHSVFLDRFYTVSHMYGIRVVHEQLYQMVLFQMRGQEMPVREFHLLILY